MKLRVRLILAFFVLAVLPLTAIVTYSYISSLAAFRGAMERETQTRTCQMTERVAAVRADLDEALGEASQQGFVNIFEGDEKKSDLGRIRAKIHAKAPWVESCEFVPAPAPALRVRPGLEPPEFPALPDPPPPPPREEAEAPDEEAFVLFVDADSGEGAFNFQMQFPDEENRTNVISMVREGGRLAMEIMQSISTEELAQLAARTEKLASLGAEHGLSGNDLRQLEDPGDPGKGASQDQLERWHEARNLAHWAWKEARAEARVQAQALLGSSFRYPVQRDGRLLGHVHAQVRPEDVLQDVLGSARREEGEIPFAIDKQGKLHTIGSSDEEALSWLPITGQPAGDAGEKWLVVKDADPVSGLTLGIARPVGQGLAEIRRTAVRNLVFGLLLLGLAGLCILPLSGSMTRNLHSLTDAAGDLAQGNLNARVPVRSSDEFGQLATAFNYMAADLSDNQERLIEHERQRQEQQVQNRLLAAENQRKSGELEEARVFQLSLLPNPVPEHPELDIAVSMRTATEVGGDYYDFRTAPDGTLCATVGDATGHGAAAGTMVTVAKSLFTAAGEPGPSSFLTGAADTIRRMDLGRTCMAMTVSHISGRRLTISAAGMPPLLLFRPRTGEVEEVLVPGMPLGSFRTASYHEVGLDLEPGDTMLFMSDGFPEQLDQAGEPLGYERAREHFAAVADRPLAALVAEMEAVADRWRQDCPQGDDITFVALRVKQ